jgi:hypothetical protein
MSYVKLKDLTTDQLSILMDKTKTAVEIQSVLGCGIATISRWRKRLGVQPPRGSKPNKPKPSLQNKVKMPCKLCKRLVDVVPSRTHKFKYCSRKCMYESEDYIDTLRRMDKSYMQTEQYRQSKTKLDTPEYRKYRNRVATLTKATYNQFKDIINPEGHTRAIAGVEGGYHLDHIISCREGFENSMTPEEISDVSNLQMLPWRDNIVKGRA